MGKWWHENSAAARAVFAEADAVLGRELGGPSLSDLCFNGPVEQLNRTDISQPAIYTTSIACWAGLIERGEIDPLSVTATAGLSLGEYTALHLAGVFDFATGLRLVATRGRLMQEAAEGSSGSMVALIGADDEQAQQVCDQARGDGVLVAANFNAPGQIVLSGSAGACERAVAIASELGLRATQLTVAGAFHSPLMQPAADQMAQALDEVEMAPPDLPVYSNVTSEPHHTGQENVKLLKDRLVQQIVSPVRWSQSCGLIVSAAGPGPEATYHELAPGTVLRGLMRRIDRNVKVISHEEG